MNQSPVAKVFGNVFVQVGIGVQMMLAMVLVLRHGFHISPKTIEGVEQALSAFLLLMVLVRYKEWMPNSALRFRKGSNPVHTNIPSSHFRDEAKS